MSLMSKLGYWVREGKNIGPSHGAGIYLLESDGHVEVDYDSAGASFVVWGANGIDASKLVGVAFKCRRDEKWHGEYLNPHGASRCTERDDYDSLVECASAVRREWAASRADEIAVEADPARHLERELASHDWYFAFSDDPAMYGGGERHRKLLNEIAEKVDKDVRRKLWDKYAPNEFECPF